jgi:hypothetical protein
MPPSNKQAVRNYYVLPCCLLLLNLVNGIIGYKAGAIADPFTRTMVVILLVLFGSSLTAFAIAPALTAGVRTLHQSSRRSAGGLGELAFILALGAAVFWVYYRVSSHGIVSIVPPAWRN